LCTKFVAARRASLYGLPIIEPERSSTIITSTDGKQVSTISVALLVTLPHWPLTVTV
jgi:hypothetical protein